MGKKERESMEELWSKRFDEEVDYSDEEPMSRKAKREREQSISPVLTVTVIFLALLIILPITTYAWYLNREVSSEEPTGPSVEQVVQDEEDDEEEPVDESEDLEESPEETPMDEPEESGEPSETVEEPSSDQETDVAETTDPAPSDEPETTEPETTPPPVTEEEPSTDQPAGAEYYIVQAGDNMYRIALNHGMRTEELMALNNLSEETVYVGQELRVK